MHTIILISTGPSNDEGILNVVKALFPECRIEVDDVAQDRNLQRVDGNQINAAIRLNSSHNTL